MSRPRPDQPPSIDPDQADIFTAAIMAGDPEIIRSAIQYGVNVNAVGKIGTPPIVLAVVQGHEEIVDILLSENADVNIPDGIGGMCALHAATIYGREAMAGKLIAKGADVNASFGRPAMTALGYAVRNGRANLVRLLLSADASPNITINTPSDPPEHRGITPLHIAASTGDLELIRMLIDRGAAADVTKADGMTPLMVAAFGGRLEAVEELIEARANPNFVNVRDPSRPFTALDLALMGGHTGIVDYLKSRGAIGSSPSTP